MESESIAMNTCIILGGGGHAKMVVEALQAQYAGRRCVILDPAPDLRNRTILGVPIVGDDSMLEELAGIGARWFAVGVGGTGDTRNRQRLYELGLSHGLEPLTIINKSSRCSNWAELGRGAQLFPGSIVNAGVVIGQNAIVNSGAILEHDCTIGDHVHVATGAVLAGMVRVGNGAHIGCGATIKESITIGERAIVGAGAVVVRNVSPDTVVVGVPARPMAPRPLNNSHNA